MLVGKGHNTEHQWSFHQPPELGIIAQRRSHRFQRATDLFEVVIQLRFREGLDNNRALETELDSQRLVLSDTTAHRQRGEPERCAVLVDGLDTSITMLSCNFIESI